MKKTDDKLVEALKVLVDYGSEIVETAERFTDLYKNQVEDNEEEAEILGVCPECGDSDCQGVSKPITDWSTKSDFIQHLAQLGPMDEKYVCPETIEGIHQQMRDFDVEEAYVQCGEIGNRYIEKGLEDTLQLIARNPYLVETVILYAMRKHDNEMMGVMNKNAQMMFHMNADADALIEHYGSEFTDHPTPFYRHSEDDNICDECDDICDNCLEEAA